MKIYEHLELLGKKAKCRVTGYEGVVTSICFDLYGCIQALIQPGINSDGKIGEPMWFDVLRIKILDEKPIMKQPNFETGAIADGKNGPAEKTRGWIIK